MALRAPQDGGVRGVLHAFAVALMMSCVAMAARLVMDIFASGVAPYLFIFPAIAGAVLLAGMRSGLMTVVICQLLTWYAVVPVRFSLEAESQGDAAGLLLSTMAELVLLWVVATYRWAVDKVAKAHSERSETLRLALRELDHRTKNNLQIIQGFLYLKSQKAKDPETSRELGAASARIGLIASINSSFARSSMDHSAVALKPYLTAVCQQLEEAICPEDVQIFVVIADVEIDSQRALYLGLIINELVTNAVKHAFPEGKGRIDVGLTREAETLVLTVADDGRGTAGERADGRFGLGTKLIQMMVRKLGARVQISASDELTGRGTRYRLELDGQAPSGSR
jgi:two-component sensor histidine kinase